MIEIKPLAHLDAAVRVPGSKSYTQRAMVLAALAEGESRLRDALTAEDTALLAEALGAFGTGIRREGPDLVVTGTSGRITRPARPIQLGNNGTAMRLLAGVASLAQGPIDLTGGKRLCERPMKPLLDALRDLGVSSWTENGLGYPPVRILGNGLKGGKAVLRNIGSSQYISALLIAAPFAASAVTLVLEGEIPSLPYVALTIETMGAFGVRVIEEGPGRYVVPCGQRYVGREYRIEGDVSSASYFFAAATLLAGRIRVENIDERTRQGDIRFLEILERLGARIERGKDHVTVAGGRMPKGEMTFDMGAMPDMVPTLAVLAALRPGKTSIRNVAHLRLKESDRLAVLARELGKTGIEARELADGLTIIGGTPQGAPIETYHDHRIAMAFAVLGMAVPGMAIAGEGCVGKSFPAFWETMEGLYRNSQPRPGGGRGDADGQDFGPRRRTGRDAQGKDGLT